MELADQIHAGDNEAKVQAGFTLVELLIALAVLVIVSAVALPRFQSATFSNRLVGDYNEVLSGLNYARSEAIKRRVVVDFIVSQSPGAGYQIKVGEGILRERNLAVEVAGAQKVSFNSLGRAVGCPCELNLKYSGVERRINISSSGSVGREQVRE